MNPMLRWASAIHEVKISNQEERMQRRRDAQKVKLRQEKEIRRLDAIERENKRRSEQKPAAAEKEGEEVKNEESAACKFQKELCWCIQQLEQGLVNMKPNAQQAVEAEKLLKVLRSSKAPMARKRQIMRASFGNYRARMQQEEKKHAEAMEKKKGVKPVECDQMNSATFFRRAASSSSSSSQRVGHIQSFIPETVAEETEDDSQDEEKKDDEMEEPNEDALMKSLESETMEMHLYRSDEYHSDKLEKLSNKDESNIGSDQQEENIRDRISNDLQEISNNKSRDEEAEEVEDEKENIPIRTPTDTDDNPQSAMSSNFSSTASLFSFNFEIKEEDMDLEEEKGHQEVSMTTATSIYQKSEAVELLLARGMDNRASDSTSSSGGTPTKKMGRKRSRGKRKKNQAQPDNQEVDAKPSPKEALLTLESPKIEDAVKEGFKFDFPEPVQGSEN